jgi:hypothetical protein
MGRRNTNQIPKTQELVSIFDIPETLLIYTEFTISKISPDKLTIKWVFLKIYPDLYLTCGL